MFETIVITLIICCGGIFGTYYSQKKKQILVEQKKQLISNLFKKIHTYEGSLNPLANNSTEGTFSLQELMQSVYKDFFEISTKYKNLCIFQQVQNQSDNEQNLNEIHQFLTKLIKLYPNAINILDLKENQIDNEDSQNQQFQNVLVKQLKQDIQKKQIKQEELYLLQIILLLINIYPLEDSIQYICCKAPAVFKKNSSQFLEYLRQILIHKISNQSIEIISNTMSDLFKTNDSHIDNETVRQIFSISKVSIEQKKNIVRTQIFELDVEHRTNLMKIISNYNVNENNSGDFMNSLKIMNSMYQKRK